MLVCLYFLDFFAVCLFFITLFRHNGQSPQEGCIVAGLVFSAQVFFFTEGLSLFNAVGNYHCFAVLYALSAAVFLAAPFFIRKSSQLPVRALTYPFQWYPILIAVLVFVPLTFVALYYPPCTWDSMSYHLPRIDHWIQNGNVGHYPTAYPRQLYYQPFAEYLMLSTHLLSGTDLFDNIIQIAALLGVLWETALLTEFFGGTKRVQTLAVLIVLTCPTAIFEAPTTQTDLIASFYFLAFLYFGLKLTVLPCLGKDDGIAARLNKSFYLSFPLALALGLSLNTKVSVAVFELPLCIWFGWRFLKIYRKKVWTVYTALVLGFLIFNTPYFVRNYNLTGHIFGPLDVQVAMRNTQFGPDTVFSNAVRIIGMQLKLPDGNINAVNRDIVKNLHDTLGIRWGDPNTTYTGSGTVPFEYDTVFYLDDNRSGNILLVLLFVIVAGTFSVRKIKQFMFPVSGVSVKPPLCPAPEFIPLLPEEPQRRRDSVVTFWLVILGFFLYNGLFRWQPFGTRLLLPDFLAGIPFLAVGLCRIVPKIRIRQLCPLFLSIAALFTAFIAMDWSFYDPLSASGSIVPDEKSKPVDGQQKANFSFENIELSAEYYTTDLRGVQRYWFERDYKYFRKAPNYMVDYMSIAARISEQGYTKIGLALDQGMDRWEYPLWALLRSKFAESDKKFRIEWVVYPEYLKNTPNYDANFVPDVILTDLVPQEITNRYEIGKPIWRYKNTTLILVPVKGRVKEKIMKN